MGTVHPHACGERLKRFNQVASEVGSSPRLWGTGPLRQSRGIHTRFIPTPVGNGRLGTILTTTSPVHPHACGERRHLLPPITQMRGSSPRLWGTAKLPRVDDLVRRFIPTPVGNGEQIRLEGIEITVHPHACGERTIPAARNEPSSGSSPRLWGTAAGAWVAAGTAAVHPHACGERTVKSAVTGNTCGSSPRLWGTGRVGCHGIRAVRFIPTPVGNGHRRADDHFAAAVHPHACGERGEATDGEDVVTGSSPRLWGTDSIIAASSAISAVHPHACGERT